MRRGKSYAMRVAGVNAIYDRYVRTGLSNREIWRRYVYPVYGCTEQTFYNLLKASSRDSLPQRRQLVREGFLFPELFTPNHESHLIDHDEFRPASYFKKKT